MMTDQDKKAAALWKKMPQKDRRLVISLAVLFVGGVLLLTLGSGGTPRTGAEAESATVAVNAAADGDELNLLLEQTLSAVKGAGQVRVAVYFSESAQSVYAMSSDSEYDGEAQSRREELALAGDAPVLIKQYRPRVSGVVVVAEGASDALVQERLYLAVKSLLGLDAGQIAIIEGERSE